MAALFELLPIVLFFIVFKIAGIYIATGVIIVTSVIQLGISWWRERRIKPMPLMIAVLAVVLGGITIALHDPEYIKWKFSVVYWLFGVVFIASQFIGDKPLVERMLGAQIDLARHIWIRLNLCWALFFLLLGGVNTYVIYHFTTEQWVDFKFYGVLGATLIFVIGQGFYLVRHVDLDAENQRQGD